MGKTTLNPSEFSNVVNGLEFVDAGLSVEQATIATAVIGRLTVLRPSVLRTFAIAIADAGSAGQTDVRVRKNGTEVANSPVSIDNAAANDSTALANVDEDLVPGDLLEIEVTAAPTGGTGLTASFETVRNFA